LLKPGFSNHHLFLVRETPGWTGFEAVDPEKDNGPFSTKSVNARTLVAGK
jgi:hypothetical protein